MATFLELAKIKHHAVRSDGAKFLDGVRDDSLNTSWLTVNSSGRVTLGPGLYDELLVVKGEVSDDQIKAWASMGAPFYDPSPVIQENQIPAAETWNKAVHDAQRALADAANAQATADGKVTTFYQDTEPIAEALGDLWVHTGEGNKLYRWSGSSWDVVQDKKIQEAVQKAEDAQATADGKIVTFYQSTPPTATAVGDLWVDTDDNDRLYRWDGTKWVDITDKSPVDAEKKPVYVKGAGADIDIDKYGIRATRKTDGTKTFEIDAETGDAFFRGDITGATGKFSGELEAEKVIGSIAEFGGLTADHIKARTISYDRMNVRFAQLTGFATGLSPSDYQAIEYVAQNQDEWNLFKMASNNPFQPEETWFITFYHQPLETLVGTFFVQVSSDGVNYTPPIYPPATSVDPTFSAWADLNDGTGNRFRVSSLAVTATSTALLFKKGLGTTSEIYLRFKRHSIN